MSQMHKKDAPRTRRLARAATALGLAAATWLSAGTAEAQEIQITGPLAGAPAVRRLRLHHEGRFEIAPQMTFTLLDEYRRTLLPGLKASYHFTDWVGASLFAGVGVGFNAALSDELQEKAIDNRACDANPNSLACRRTAVNLCRGPDCLSDNQLGRYTFLIAPQLTVVPFRGKLALFSSAFVDTDINLFVGPAIIGLQERKECAAGQCASADAFELEGRVTATATFGLGLNFYPADFFSFGAEFRGTPFEWNTAGFDTAGGGTDEEFPDDAIDGADRSFHFNPMLTIYAAFQLPTEIKVSD